MKEFKLYDCHHCNTKGVLPMEGFICPNCKQSLDPSCVNKSPFDFNSQPTSELIPNGDTKLSAIRTCSQCEVAFPKAYIEYTREKKINHDNVGTQFSLDAIETKSSLDSVREKYLLRFLLHRLKWIGLGIVIFVLVVAIGYSVNITNSEDTFGELLLVGTGMFGLFIVGYQIIRSINGVPNAKRYPEATVEQFYLDAFDYTFSEGFESYFCLLNKAKSEFTDLKVFKHYWKSTRDSIFQEAKKLYTGFNVLIPKVEKIEVCEKTGNTAQCSLILKLKMILEYNVTGAPVQREHQGNVYLKTDVSLVKIGDRWYMKSGKWHGVFRGTALRNTIYLDSHKFTLGRILVRSVVLAFFLLLLN